SQGSPPTTLETSGCRPSVTGPDATRTQPRINHRLRLRVQHTVSPGAFGVGLGAGIHNLAGSMNITEPFPLVCTANEHHSLERTPITLHDCHQASERLGRFAAATTSASFGGTALPIWR